MQMGPSPINPKIYSQINNNIGDRLNLVTYEPSENLQTQILAEHQTIFKDILRDLKVVELQKQATSTTHIL